MVFIITQAHYFDIYASVCMYTCVLSKGSVTNMYILIYVRSKISNGYIVFVKGHIFAV